MFVRKFLVFVPILLALWVPLTASLNNGLALTPPMGWNSWNHFSCSHDCQDNPEYCISERLVMEMADIMVASGMKDAGYEYVNLDDCWMATPGGRGADGKLFPTPDAFPHGMKYVVDYVHSKGLKFGIYESCGTTSCCGFAGSYGHAAVDAETFASWGVDFVKLDGCFVPDPSEYKQIYTDWSIALNATGRPMVFSCSWPAYESSVPGSFDYNYITEICNMWRYIWDMQNFYSSWVRIANYTATAEIAQYAQPGAWNDPDMLEIGNDVLTDTESRAFFSIWAMLAAPLIAGNDLRAMTWQTLEILTNKDVIAIDQDPLGRQGNRIQHEDATGMSIWTRQLYGGDVAVAFLNTGNTTRSFITTLHEVGMRGSASVYDCWAHRTVGVTPHQLEAEVVSHGVVLYRLHPL